MKHPWFESSSESNETSFLDSHILLLCDVVKVVAALLANGTCIDTMFFD